MDRFAEILFDLGKEMGSDLYPDEHRVCQLNYNDKLTVQILYDAFKEQLLIGAFLAEVPPGKYRESLLRAGLIHNAEEGSIGILAYSERNNQLTLYTTFHAVSAQAGPLHKLLLAFIDEALKWKTAVEKGGALPTKELPESSEKTMFGLKP